MTHDEFRGEMARAVAAIDAGAVGSCGTAREDRGYLRDALVSSETFDIDAETVTDALAIASEY